MTGEMVRAIRGQIGAGDEGKTYAGCTDAWRSRGPKETVI